MSKPANKTLIGAFVVGATALLLLAIAVFGSGKLFQTTSRYVLFFDGSISGLSVGSPVLFRGVPVAASSKSGSRATLTVWCSRPPYSLS